MTAERIIEILGLEPLPVEGGYYRETYRSEEVIQKSSLPVRYNGDRLTGSAIYYLITPETFSSLHKLPSDEIFHFYLGDPVEMLQLYEDGTGKVIKIGNDIANGYFPQATVPKNTWQGTRLVDGGTFALMGTTMAPGFEFADFVKGEREELVGKYPGFAERIVRLL
jgi:uncharacterized protein